MSLMLDAPASTANPPSSARDLLKLTEQFGRLARRNRRAASEASKCGTTSVRSIACTRSAAAAPAINVKLTDQEKRRTQPNPDPNRYQEMPRAAVHSEAIARQYLERMRWPSGPVCPRCQGKNVVRFCGAASLLGQLNCRACRRKFTVTVGTCMERSRLSLPTWVCAMQIVAEIKTRRVPKNRRRAYLNRELEGRVSYPTVLRLIRVLQSNERKTQSV